MSRRASRCSAGSRRAGAALRSGSGKTPLRRILVRSPRASLAEPYEVGALAGHGGRAQPGEIGDRPGRDRPVVEHGAQHRRGVGLAPAVTGRPEAVRGSCHGASFGPRPGRGSRHYGGMKSSPALARCRARQLTLSGTTGEVPGQMLFRRASPEGGGPRAGADWITARRPAGRGRALDVLRGALRVSGTCSRRPLPMRGPPPPAAPQRRPRVRAAVPPPDQAAPHRTSDGSPPTSPLPASRPRADASRPY